MFFTNLHIAIKGNNKKKFIITPLHFNSVLDPYSKNLFRASGLGKKFIQSRK